MTDSESPAWMCGKADRRRASNFGASLRLELNIRRIATVELCLGNGGREEQRVMRIRSELFLNVHRRQNGGGAFTWQRRAR
jgi:hypothetical protein